MDSPEITETFRPAPGDPQTLSKAGRKTLHALHRHPIAHNLEWADVVSLFEALGSVDQRSHNEMAFAVGGAHHVVRKPHDKDLTAPEIMEFRHILSRAGWSPRAPVESDPSADTSGSQATADAGPPDLLVVAEHHAARLYRLDVRSPEPLEHVITPYDPHHVLHHLSHKDRSRERGQRAPEDPSFYKRLADALAPAQAIVVIGHGAGHSNAAHHLVEYLRLHHPETFRKVASEIVADISSLTPPQLLVLGRRALSSPPRDADRLIDVEEKDSFPASDPPSRGAVIGVR